MKNTPNEEVGANQGITEPIRRLIELNQQGGHIPEGLRAAASEYTARGIRKAYYQLADVVEAGGTPAGYSPSDLVTLIAVTATSESGSRPQQESADRTENKIALMAPNLMDWGDGQRAVRQAIAMIETHLWLAVLLIFLGGLTNWLMVWLTQKPFLDLVNEFELDLGQASMQFFVMLGWVGPVVMLLASIGALILLMYRIGPLREPAEYAVYCIPLVGKALRRLHFAIMCEGVSRFLAAGMGYPQAFRGASKLVTSRISRDWLERASRAVEQGGAVVEAVKYLPSQGEILPALVGPVGPSADHPEVGWQLAGNYFRSAGIRGSGSARVLVPFFSIIGTSLGWLGMTAIFVPMISLISSLGGF